MPTIMAITGFLVNYPSQKFPLNCLAGRASPPPDLDLPWSRISRTYSDYALAKVWKIRLSVVLRCAHGASMGFTGQQAWIWQTKRLCGM